MSTARPLPLEPLNPAEVTEAEGNALRQQVVDRLEQHRRRRAHAHAAQAALPGMDSHADANWTRRKPNRIASSVAERFAKSPSYCEFLEQEAEAATRQAEAAAEIARRNAEAVAAAQMQLLQEMETWNRQAAMDPEPVQIAVMPSTLPFLAGTVSAMPESGRVEADVDSAKATVAVAPTLASSTAPAPVASAPSPTLELPPSPAEPPLPLPANLIEFPRQLVAARKARPRLAEGPLREESDVAPENAQLRIFEVEASAFSTAPAVTPEASLPEWSTIRLDGHADTRERKQPIAESAPALPVHAAPLQLRVMAAIVDGCCIGTAFLLAVAAAAQAGGALPTGVLAGVGAMLTLLLFTAGYLLLCFTLSGHTPGMRYARIALCTFGDDNPTRGAIRRRLFAYALSGLSLGLGFAWALLDDDKLGWHDRISRMYQRAY